MTYLKHLRHLRSVDIPVLLDDLLVHVPAEPEDLLSTTDTSQTPSAPIHPLSRPRQEFEANVNDIMTRTTQGLFIGNSSTTQLTSLITPLPTSSMSTSFDPLFLLHETEAHTRHTSLPLSSYFALHAHEHEYDDISQPLPHLRSLRFRIHPTPRLARDLRSVRVYVPAVNWVRETIVDEKQRPSTPGEVNQTS